jgi:hypothetical protein
MRRKVAALVVLALVSNFDRALARPPEPLGFDSIAPRSERGAGLQPVLAAGTDLPGEQLGSPIPIAVLPFTDARSSCVYRDDLAASCTFLGGAPDVVYAYVPPSDLCVDLSLCDSSYDTALHVYENGAAMTCNDDFCGQRSRIEGLRLRAGYSYDIVVDGWAGECGNYVLDVRECAPPCALEAPPGAVSEDEPRCSDGHVDRFNTGCNDFPYVFSRLPCDEASVTVLGTYGTWRMGGEEHRDTDWYEIVVVRPTRLGIEVTGAAATQVAIFDGTRGCEWEVVCGAVIGAACETLACEAAVPPGLYWLYVAPQRFEGVACGTSYLLRLRGHACRTVGVEPSTWGSVKASYR